MRAIISLLALASLTWGAMLNSASAHGLLARVRTEGNVVVGTAFYSSGERAAGDWVEIFDVSNREQKVAGFSSGPDGTFRYEGIAGHRYRIAIYGEEGHSIDLSITILQGARAHLVEDAIKPAERGLTQFPAWLVVGGALAITSLLAAFYRVRDLTRSRKGCIESTGILPP